MIEELNGENIIRTFYEKELQKTKWDSVKEKNNKLWVKWIGYDNPFNSWIDMSFSLFNGNVKAEVDLCSYVAKSDIKKQQVLIYWRLLKWIT